MPAPARGTKRFDDIIDGVGSAGWTSADGPSADPAVFAEAAADLVPATAGDINGSPP